VADQVVVRKAGLFRRSTCLDHPDLVGARTIAVSPVEVLLAVVFATHV
jgi:hypothetical protein